ncbi:MAG: lysophospholipid acyltransferase family protein [Acidobacteriota bacterium]
MRSLPAPLGRLVAWIKIALCFLWTALWVSVAFCILGITRSARVPKNMASWPWAAGILRLGPARLEVRGLERVDWSKPYFLAANHQSFLDIPVLFRALPQHLHFVAKQELTRLPFVAGYIRAMGMIFVDRSNPEKAQESIRHTAEAVAGGRSVLIFPEGTRSPRGEVRRFKSGMLSAALHGDVPIVPIAVHGTADVLPRNMHRFRAGRVIVEVGEPLLLDDYGPADRRRLANDVQQRVAALHAGLLRLTSEI